MISRLNRLSARLSLLTLAALWGSAAQAQVGQSVTPVLQSAAFKAAKKGVGDTYTLPSGLVVQLGQRSGLLLSAVVVAPMTPAGLTQASQLVGDLTGFGEGLATPLLAFLKSPDLGPRLGAGITVSADPFVFIMQSQGKNLRLGVSPQQVAVGGLKPAAHVLPAKTAGAQSVPIRIFSDFQCPYCLQFETQTWPGLLKGLPNDVRAEFHQFPLESIHPVARPAAEASECAAQQGQFWPYKDALFADRRWLSGNPNEVFVALADKLKLNGDKFKSCLALRGGKAAVDAGVTEAAKLGLNGTPTVLVGPYVAQNPYDAAALLRLVALARAAAAAPASAVSPALLPVAATPVPATPVPATPTPATP